MAVVNPDNPNARIARAVIASMSVAPRRRAEKRGDEVFIARSSGELDAIQDDPGRLKDDHRARLLELGPRLRDGGVQVEDRPALRPGDDPAVRCEPDVAAQRRSGA